ncbi:hypothetical protein ACNFR7_28965 [Streptomyces sp. RM1]
MLLPVVVRHWKPRMPGSVFLCCVATEALVVSAAGSAAAEHTAWLAHTALVLFWLGPALYVLALFRFDPRQLLEGAGDHWVAGGALAFSAPAGAGLLAAGDEADLCLCLWDDDDRDALRMTTVVLPVLCLAACAVLLVAEAVRPRLCYDEDRWATAFPLGDDGGGDPVPRDRRGRVVAQGPGAGGGGGVAAGGRRYGRRRGAHGPRRGGRGALTTRPEHAVRSRARR